MTTLPYDLTDDQRTILSALTSFLKKEVAPGSAERDQTGEFPMQIVKTLGEMGIMGAQTPEQYGGSGLDTATFALIIEEIAAYDGSLCLTVASHNSLCQGHILIGGTEAQKQKFLPDLASRSQAGRVGPDRTRQRLRQRRPRHPRRRAAGRQLDSERLQELHHPGQRGRNLRGAGPHRRAREGQGQERRHQRLRL